MPRPILFVVGQSATVAYLAPVWQRWLARGTPTTWRVVAAEPAAQRIAYERLDRLPVIRIETDEVAHLEAALDGFTPEGVVMSASFAPVERSALAFARRRRLPVARIIDTWYGYRRRLLAPTGSLELPEALLVIDEAAAREAVAEGIPERIIRIVGQPAWEHVEVLPPGDRRDILFVSQPIERFYGNSLGYTEKTVWSLFCHAARSFPGLARRIYYSAHPDDDMPPPVEEGVEVVLSGLATLPMVGSVVGMFSSLVTDALLSGRHVVSFQPGAIGQNMCALGRTGLVPRAMTPDELAHCLRQLSPDISDLRRALNCSTDRVERFCLEFSGAT